MTCFWIYDLIFRSSLPSHITTLNAVHIIVTIPYAYYTGKLQFCDVYIKLVFNMSSILLCCVVYMSKICK
jgi:hypothetical protein